MLDDLPEWFGIPEAKDAYVAGADTLPMLSCRAGSDIAGFLSLKPQTAAAAEIYVMGVRRSFHRQGIGRALTDAAARWAVGRGLRFLTVKTLAADNPDPHYALTRRFYEAVGFLPLEVFPALWDERNPCLLMVRPLD
ncbi:GNAT family N-acetyltransferase [Emcibacter sp. SYSU 3D8]|uniref:GNAT family N-acetyltransferase n=1 Tax=Emcibacter sp. SYSU 3D8 TaxID=3133969 RepID=UPI0031FEEEB6